MGATYSPEARGPMERAFGTLQGRLPRELRVRGLASMADANRYLREVFMADFNARFGVPAAEAGTAFVGYAGPDLADTLSVQENRQVGRDNCVSWHGRSLQIPQQAHRHHYVRATVRVHEQPGGQLAIFDGPRRAPSKPGGQKFRHGRFSACGMYYVTSITVAMFWFQDDLPSTRVSCVSYLLLNHPWEPPYMPILLKTRCMRSR